MKRAGGTALARVQKRRHLGVGRYRGLGTWTVLCFAFLYMPIGVLIIYSFNASSLAMTWTGFSLDWYAKVLRNDSIQYAAVNSLVIATISTIAATAIATAAALALVRGIRFTGQTASFGLVTLPLVVPEIVTAVAVLIFFANLDLNLGIGNVIIAHTTFCIPFAFMPIRARLTGMDTSLEQAARDLYSSDWQTFRYVTAPLLMPGIISGAMLSFVISLDDFIITLMVAPAGATTLPVYIYSMIRQGITPEVNAISSVFFAVSVVLVTMYWLVSRRAASASADSDQPSQQGG